jgi:phage protein D
MSKSGDPKVECTLGGTKVDDSDFQSFVLDRDINQPDMCAITASNQGAKYSRVKVGDPVELKVGDDSTTIFKGKIIGLEPNFTGGQKTRLTIRAMNSFHELIRKKSSTTYANKTDQQILQEVAGRSGLSLQFKHDSPPAAYKNVYQHNQTDMEFLRTRAARIGCHVWCVDKTLYCKQPDLGAGPIFEVKLAAEAGASALLSFTPRTGSSHIVKKITVKGWNPETKALITGEATAKNSSLGGQNAAAASGDLGENESFTVDQPIWDAKEAKCLAEAKLQEASLTYMTGEARITGNAKADLGKIVKITSNEDPAASPGDDPFNGKYYIMGLTHQFMPSAAQPFITVLRLARDAEKG